MVFLKARNMPQLAVTCLVSGVSHASTLFSPILLHKFPSSTMRNYDLEHAFVPVYNPRSLIRYMIMASNSVLISLSAVSCIKFC